MIFRPFDFFLERLAGVGAEDARGSVAAARASVDPGESVAGGRGVPAAPHGVRPFQSALGPASKTGRSAGGMTMEQFAAGVSEIGRMMRRQSENRRRKRLRRFNAEIKADLEYGRG